MQICTHIIFSNQRMVQTFKSNLIIFELRSTLRTYFTIMFTIKPKALALQGSSATSLSQCLTRSPWPSHCWTHCFSNRPSGVHPRVSTPTICSEYGNVFLQRAKSHISLCPVSFWVPGTASSLYSEHFTRATCSEHLACHKGSSVTSHALTLPEL